MAEIINGVVNCFNTPITLFGFEMTLGAIFIGTTLISIFATLICGVLDRKWGGD